MKGRTKMGGLNLYTDEDSGVASEKKKRSRSPKIILGLCVLLAIPVIGTTFASTVTINTNHAVDFGQGQAGAIACDPQIQLSPGAAFTPTGWKLETVTITGINTTSTAGGDGSTGCATDSLSLTAYASDTSTIPGTTVSFTLPASGTTATNLVGATSVTDQGPATSDTVTVVLSTQVNLGTYNVSGFTIQQN
jgi:hypothetical protein